MEKEVVAGIYIRKSRKDKDKPSHRLEYQRVYLPEYAVSQGWRPEVYDDGHASAMREKLDGLHQRARLEADIRAQKIDVVLVIELERLSRDEDLQDLPAWLKLCAKYGVKLATPSRILDPANSMEWFYLIMEGGLSALEVRKTKSRMRDGFGMIYTSGRFLGGTPPAPYKLSMAGQAPEVDKGDLVRMQKLWKLAETTSAKAIASELHMPEITVRRAISDDRLLFYQSLRLNPQTGEYFRCQWEPVMDAAQAERIRSARRTRKNGDARRGEPASLLTNLGLFYCSYCNSTIKIHYNSKARKDGSRLYYYGCQRSCEPARMYAQPIVNEGVVTNIFNTLANLDALKKYWLAEQNRNDHSDELKQLANQERRFKKEKDRLVSLYRKGTLDESDIEKDMAEIKSELRQIETKRQELLSFQAEEPDWSALDFDRRDFNRLDLVDKRAFIKAVIARIDVYKNDLIITYHFPRNADGDCTSRIHLPPPQRGTAAGRLPRISIA